MNKVLREELMKLTPAERLEVAQDLWDSVAAHPESLPPPSADQIAEAIRELEKHEKDPNTALPWEEVRAALWARLK